MKLEYPLKMDDSRSLDNPRMDCEFLFRALRQDEIGSGNVLIPKSTESFRSDPLFDIDTAFPILFGSEANTVRQHQWNQRGFPTRGVSTTPVFERALFYAKPHGVIVKIVVSKLAQFQIRAFEVNRILANRPEEIAAMEDQEVILVYGQDGPFPKEIVCEVIEGTS